MKLPCKTLEKKLFADGCRLIYAVDEVGMGCLAGPVVVCAVGFEKKFFNRQHKKLHWLRDSKLLPEKRREEYAKELLTTPGLKFQVCCVYPKAIDRLNIYQSARLAMRRAIENLESRILKLDSKFKIQNSIILIDGKTKIDGLSMKQIPIVKGDKKVFAIACASIIAKVKRDKMMVGYAKKYSKYGFEKHKGYATKYHQTQLNYLGPCAIHRKSFRLKY